jgi:hypothetical protein
MVDHFEPQNGGASQERIRERMSDWMDRYPKVAGAHRDAEGKIPPHSFFYPWDEFEEWEFSRLAELCAGGWGEIELHLHHCDDTEEILRDKLREAIQAFRSYGALSLGPDGRPAFGFIHGNWALNNSRSQEEKNWCGVNDEATVLLSEGCYADFTFPAWRQTAQPRQVNSIYYAPSSPAHPKGHDRGERAAVGQRKPPPGLLMIQGALVPYLDQRGGGRSWGMDDSDVASYRRYHPERLDRWVKAGIHVLGRPDRIFVKLHTHGAPEENRHALLGKDLDALFSDAEARYNDGERYRLHYVTAREMYNVIRATMDEAGDDLMKARDYLLKPPTP